MNHEPEADFSPGDAPAFQRLRGRLSACIMVPGAGGCVTSGWPGAAACCASCCS